jgi:hypothetical protein
MEDAGLFIIGAVLQILLCKGEADKLECRPMHPQQFETGKACVEAAQGMAASISTMEPDETQPQTEVPPAVRRARSLTI